ncbi:type VI secretion system-associated protein TagO [Nioella nitratireducens]|uniref:type VI secretion system-associated protein TagO n=1 Tax=Nioella nitratireducens TaxID=1287720 RepID=UPI0008FD4EA2|nr:type VI secretion system-associated protein TagO [Nioella nitratireducens]
MKRLATCLVLLATPALADETACIAITDDAARLSCYDDLFGAPPPAAPPVETAWETRIERSDMTDDTNVYLTVQSNEPVHCGWGAGGHPTLYLRCRENTTAVIFSTGCHMASGFGGYGQVTYRLDRNDPRERGFTESTNNRSLGLWRGGQAIPFIRDMFGHDTLRARMTPFSENAIEMTFDISGVEEAVTPLREACNW